MNAYPLIFNTPVDVCRKRAIESGQPDLIPVIDRHYGQLQKLLDEGIDNVLNRLRNDTQIRRNNKVV